MQSHHGRIGVVVFEEFEKLGDAAKEALLHPFESGEWSIKKPGQSISVNCSDIIFLMTSNLKNQDILDWMTKEKAIEKYTNAKSQKEKDSIKQWIMQKVSDIIKNHIKSGRVKEFARRIEVIPFVSFSGLQQQVIVEEIEEKISSRYTHPPSGQRIIGNLELWFTKKYTNKVLEQYDPLEGATSLVSVVEKHIKEVAIEIQKETPTPDCIWFYINPEYDTRDYSFTKVTPQEKTEDDNEDVPQKVSSPTMSAPSFDSFGQMPPDEF